MHISGLFDSAMASSSARVNYILQCLDKLQVNSKTESECHKPAAEVSLQTQSGKTLDANFTTDEKTSSHSFNYFQPSDVEVKVTKLKKYVEDYSSCSPLEREDGTNMFEFFMEHTKQLMTKPEYCHIIRALILILLRSVDVFKFLQNNCEALHPETVTKLCSFFKEKIFLCKIYNITTNEKISILSKEGMACLVNYIHAGWNFCHNIELYSNHDKVEPMNDIFKIDGLWPIHDTAMCKTATHYPLHRIEVVRYTSHLHFWAYIGEDFCAELINMKKELLKYCQGSNRKFFFSAPTVGDIVGCMLNQDVQRAVVVKVDGLYCMLYAVDTAMMHTALWCVLFYIPKSIQDVAPLVKLCQIKGVVPRPNVPLVVKSLLLLQKICSFGNRDVLETIKLNRGQDILYQLMKCPDLSIQENSLGCLLILMEDSSFRRYLVSNGIFQLSNVTTLTEQLLKKAPLQSVLLRRHAYGLIREISGFKEENNVFRSTRKDSHVNLPHSKFRSLPEPRRALLPDPKHMAGPQKEKWVSVSPDSDAFDSMDSEPSSVACGEDSKTEEEALLAGTRLNVKSDETKEIRPTTNIYAISLTTLSKIMCSLLNTGLPSIIYYGLTENAFVMGVEASRQERDALRVGIDKLVGSHIVPHLNYAQFSIVCIPVIPRRNSPVHTKHSKYVIQIGMAPDPDVIYTLKNGDLFLRRNDETFRACAQDLRQLVVGKVEARYEKEILKLKAIARSEARDSSIY